MWSQRIGEQNVIGDFTDRRGVDEAAPILSLLRLEALDRFTLRIPRKEAMWN